MSESVAHDQLRAFVERILRMKEEARAINDDIKEIYAEAKGNGFDKTALGKVVNHVEKRAKSPETLAEQEALFDLYLSAYDGHAPSHTHAHAREDVPDHDPETGEIIERHGGEKPVIPSSPQAANAGGDDADGASESGAPIQEPQPLAAQTVQAPEPACFIAAEGDAVETSAPIQPETADETHRSPSTNDEASPEAGPQAQAPHSQGTGAGTLAGREGRSEGEAASADLPTHSEPPEGAPAGKSVGDGVGSATPAAPSNVTPLRSAAGLERMPGCQKPTACAGMWNKRCYSCEKKWNAAHVDEAATG